MRMFDDPTHAALRRRAGGDDLNMQEIQQFNGIRSSRLPPHRRAAMRNTVIRRRNPTNQQKGLIEQNMRDLQAVDRVSVANSTDGNRDNAAIVAALRQE